MARASGRIACDLDTERLREAIHAMYTRVATSPDGTFHFHRGPDYAAAMLGYDAAALVSLLESRDFSEARIAERFDCFRGTSKEHVARTFGMHGVNVFARKLPSVS